MTCEEIMTPSPTCCSPDHSSVDAAELMQREDVGLVPVGTPLSIEVPTARLRKAGQNPERRVRHVVDATRSLLNSLDSENV